jgi:hypothetical protein
MIPCRLGTVHTQRSHNHGRGAGATMRVEQQHALGQAEAIRRIDTFLDELMARPPGGVTIGRAEKTWTGNRMDFALNASRGFFGATVSGAMVVTDDTVEIETSLPGLVRSFVGEDAVRDAISRELARVLA